MFYSKPPRQTKNKTGKTRKHTDAYNLKNPRLNINPNEHTMDDVFRIASAKIGPMDPEVLSSRYTIDFGGKSSDLSHKELITQAKTLYDSD